MATGAIGGVPTTTSRLFNWSSSLTNFVFYTCPTNTISYVNLRHCGYSALSVGNTISQIGVTFTTSVSGTQYRNMVLYTAINQITGFAFGPLMGNSVWFNLYRGSPFALTTNYSSGLLGQASEPNQTGQMTVTVGGVGQVCGGTTGTLILYPGQSLYLTSTVATGSLEILYDTLEITAGA